MELVDCCGPTEGGWRSMLLLFVRVRRGAAVRGGALQCAVAHNIMTFLPM